MLSIVGMGPGDQDNMTFKAYETFKNADRVIGYKKYTQLVQKIFTDIQIEEFGMMKERDRCQRAIELAKTGENIVLVSSGDSGVYGMAGLAYEMAEGQLDFSEIEVISGISALSACGSLLGAPLMHDFVVISLSDLLTDWNLIEKRLHLAGQGDFVTVLYNPKSQGRKTHIEKARDILMTYRDDQTPVGIVTNCGREDESRLVDCLKSFCQQPITMTSTVFVGNSHTKVVQGKMITPRGYLL